MDTSSPNLMWVHATVHPPAKDEPDSTNYSYSDLQHLAQTMHRAVVADGHSDHAVVGGVLASFIPQDRALHVITEISDQGPLGEIVRDRIQRGYATGASLKSPSRFYTSGGSNNDGRLVPIGDPLDVSFMDLADAERGPQCKIHAFATSADMARLRESERNGGDINMQGASPDRQTAALLHTVRDIQTRRERGESVYPYNFYQGLFNMQAEQQQPPAQPQQAPPAPAAAPPPAPVTPVAPQEPAKAAAPTTAAAPDPMVKLAEVTKALQDTLAKNKDLSAQISALQIATTGQQVDARQKRMQAMMDDTGVWAKTANRLMKGMSASEKAAAWAEMLKKLEDAKSKDEKQRIAQDLASKDGEYVDMVTACGAVEAEAFRMVQDQARELAVVKKENQDLTAKNEELKQKTLVAADTVLAGFRSITDIAGTEGRFAPGAKRTAQESPFATMLAEAAAAAQTPPPEKRLRADTAETNEIVSRQPPPVIAAAGLALLNEIFPMRTDKIVKS